MGNLLRRQRVNVYNDIIYFKYEFDNYDETVMYAFLKYRDISIEKLVDKYGTPVEINYVDDCFYPECDLEDIWLFSELRRCKIYKRYRWDDFCIYTYRFKNKQELVWSMIRYYPIENMM